MVRAGEDSSESQVLAMSQVFTMDLLINAKLVPQEFSTIISTLVTNANAKERYQNHLIALTKSRVTEMINGLKNIHKPDKTVEKVTSRIVL